MKRARSMAQFNASALGFDTRTADDRIKAWGGTGVFWGGIWGLLLAPTVFMLPGLGEVGMAGPFATALACALACAVACGGLAALGAILIQGGGIPRMSHQA